MILATKNIQIHKKNHIIKFIIPRAMPFASLTPQPNHMGINGYII